MNGTVSSTEVIMEKIFAAAAAKVDVPAESLSAFKVVVSSRLQAGAIEYGDESYARSVEDLIEECLQEYADAVGWMIIIINKIGVSAFSRTSYRQVDLLDFFVERTVRAVKDYYMWERYAPELLEKYRVSRRIKKF